MKKLLTILGAVGLTATAGVTVVACGTKTENLSKMSVEELNNKMKKFIETGKKLVEEGGDNPTDHPDILEKMVRNAFEMYTFISKVFLETDYAVEIQYENEEFTPIVRKAKDSVEYKELLQATIKKFEGFLNEKPDKNYQDYIDALVKWVNKLKEQLEGLNK